MADLTTFRSKVNATVPDKGQRVLQEDKDRFITEAVKQYSVDRPRIVTAELTGDGTTQVFTVPSGWTNRFSVLKFYEHPIDQVPQIERDLQDEIKVIERVDNVELIQLTTQVLAAAEKARIRFSAQHIVSESESTIPDNDLDAVANLAASKVARAMAAFFGESTAPTLGADVVLHDQKATLFTALGDRLLKMYVEHVSSGEVVTGVVDHFDTDLLLTRRREPIFHRSQFH